MPKKNETAKKEVYRLWWDYLKRNLRYKEYCEKIPTKASKEQSEVIQVWQAELTHHWRAQLRSIVPSVLLKNPKDPFERGYEIWGDVHETDFEEWWKWQERGEIPVQEASFPIRKLMRMEKESSLFVNKRPPRLDEFINGLSTRLENNPIYIFLAVRKMPDMSIAEMGNEFCKFLREQRATAKEDRKTRASYPWIIPTPNLHYDEVKRYLRVYDLRSNPCEKGLKWREIAAKVYPKKNFSDALRTGLEREEKKARAIIANVGKGFFPGSYQNTR